MVLAIASLVLAPLAVIPFGLLLMERRRFRRALSEQARELTARDAMFRRIVNHVPVAVTYFDRNLACQWMSPEAQARLGITDEETGRITAANFPLFGDFAAELETVMAAGEPRHDTNVPMPIRVEGRELLTYWDYSLIPCLDASGQPDGILALGHEVTDRIEKEQFREEQIKALEASEALKDHFLNSLSHEIRSPLTVILGTAMLFQGDVLGPLTDKQRVYVAKLLRNGRDLSRLVNNVIESNRLRSGRLELHPERLALGDLLSEVQSEFQASVGLKGQQLIVEAEEELPLLRGDRRRVLQIWTNLVANAVQYAPEGARIRLAIRVDGESLLCEVFNTGSRISQDKLPELFGALDHPDRGQKGLGLGLGLSKALVEAHGGSLVLLNQAEGVMARFSLPLDASPV